MYWRLLRRNHDFRLLYLGTLISLGGDWFLTVALFDLVLSLTGSATLVSLMLLCQTLPIFLVTPLAGALVDKVDRRKLMITVDVVRIFACLIPLLARSASQSALPNVVAKDDLLAANVLMGSTWGAMLAVGAGIGGLVTMRFGRDASFIVDACSFLISALLLGRMRARFSEEREAGHEHPRMIESIRQTVKYARSQPRVLALLTTKGGYGIGAGVITMLSVFGKEVFRAGAFGIGILFAARGVGALVGPFALRAAIRNEETQYRMISAATVVFGIGYVSLGFSQSLWVGAAAICAAHLGGGAQWQISTYGLQREVPDHLRGRLFAADHGLVTLTMSISSLAAGVMSDHFGAVIATVATASLCIVWAIVWAVWTRKLWR
jgi:MFS family permease